MKSLVLAVPAVTLALCAASAAPPPSKKQQVKAALAGSQSEPSVSFGAPPLWVEPQPSPSTDPAAQDSPFQFLLTSSQERLTSAGVENFVEYVVQPLNLAGVQGLGTVIIPWNINRTSLTLNEVQIERGGKTIDALRKEDVSVIRREAGLEQSMLTGVRTVVMPIRDLQVGDKLRVGFTYEMPTKLGATEEAQAVDLKLPVRHYLRRFLIADSLPVKWSADPLLKETDAPGPPGFHERSFIANDLKPGKSRDYVPGRFTTRLIQVSAFNDWSAVAEPLVPMLDLARKVPDDSPVAELARKIAADHPDAKGKMLAALRVVQDDVRYVALLLGDGDYKPMAADEVWSRRFGDCKGKTALLLALLDRLGIQAEPVLASTQYDDGLERRLPSLALFDHMYVRSHLAGETYYLDGTGFGQRTLEELRDGSTRHVLPLVAGAALVTIPDHAPSMPLQDSTLVWDASKGVTGEIPFQATLVLRGKVAASYRVKTANSTDSDKLRDSLKSLVPGVSNDALEFVSSEPDAADGSYIAHFKGMAEIDWRPIDGMAGNRMEFSQTTLTWDGKFDRDDDGDGKDLPVLLAYPYWEHSVEKILLPDGARQFRLEAEPIDETVAGTRLTRSVAMADGAITITNDFKRLQREMTAAEARSAKDHLDKIAGDFAYVVSKKKLNIPK